MTDPKRVALVAAMAHLVRPDWPERSIRTHLDVHHVHRPGYQLLVAAAACYADPATATPARLGENGPWWRAAYAAAGEIHHDAQPPRHLPGVDDTHRYAPDVARRGAAACRQQLADPAAADAARREGELARLLLQIRALLPGLSRDQHDRLIDACHPREETSHG